MKITSLLKRAVLRLQFNRRSGLLAVALLGGSLTAAQPPAFAVGQTWSYQTRAGEEASRLTILAIDADMKVGTVYHVAVVDLKLRTTLAARETKPWQMTTAAFSADALRRSVTELTASPTALDVPGFAKDHAAWKAQQAVGKHRYWELSVAEMVTQREAMIQKGRRS